MIIKKIQYPEDFGLTYDKLHHALKTYDADKAVSLMQDLANIENKMLEDYYGRFSDNPEGLIDDIREILEAVEASDFDQYRGQNAERLKSELKRCNEDISEIREEIEALKQRREEPEKLTEGRSDADETIKDISGYIKGLNRTLERVRARKKEIKHQIEDSRDHCLDFLSEQIEVQIRGLEKYKRSKDQVRELISQTATRIGYGEKQIPEARNTPKRVLTSPKTSLAALTISTKADSTRSDVRWIDSNDGYHKVFRVGSKSSISVLSPVMDRIIKQTGATALKILDFYLEKISRQVLRTGDKFRSRQAIDDQITFNIQELIERGIYDTKKRAKIGMERDFDLLSAFVYKETREDGKRTSGVLFSKLEIDRIGDCTVKINEDLAVSEFRNFFTMPGYAGTLSSGAYRLCRLICESARNKREKSEIEDHNYFSIAMETIRSAMALPTIQEIQEMDHASRHPKKLIRDKIESAVKEIQEAEADNPQGLALEILTDIDSVSVDSWLKNGKLKVTLSGKVGESLIRSIERKRAEAEKKQAMQDDAEVLKMAAKNA